MKAYTCTLHDGWDRDYCEPGCVVWANGVTEAAKLALVRFQQNDDADPDDAAVRISVVEVSWGSATPPVPAQDSPHVERRIAVERLCGFRFEGDTYCDSCDQYEMDGQFPVCGECGLCRDCAAGSDCSCVSEVAKAGAQ